MDILKNANLGIRFLLELCLLGSLVLASLSLWSDHQVKWLATIGLPWLAASIWGIFVAPKSRHRLDQPSRLIVEIALFGAASGLLYFAGFTYLSLTLMIAVIVNEILIVVWKQ